MWHPGWDHRIKKRMFGKNKGIPNEVWTSVNINVSIY